MSRGWRNIVFEVRKWGGTGESTMKTEHPNFGESGLPYREVDQY